MRLSSLGLLLLSIASVDAFQDTSPFFLLSTSDIPISSPQIISEASLNKAVINQLQNCPSDVYVLVSQPGVNAADFQDPFSAPYLRQKLIGQDEEIRSRLIISDVVGNFDSASLGRILQDQCGVSLLEVDASTGSFEIPQKSKKLLIHLKFPSLPATNSRLTKLIDHDSFLASLLLQLPSNQYTVLYTTTPSPSMLTDSHPNHMAAQSDHYQIDTTFQFPTHLELKRDFTSHNQQRASNSNDTSDSPNSSAPLFEKYQFFGPGIFMGLLVSILLLSILFVAIRGVASLQVSYAAFDKEMGPAAQKKQQSQQHAQ